MSRSISEYFDDKKQVQHQQNSVYLLNQQLITLNAIYEKLSLMETRINNIEQKLTDNSQS